MSQYKFSNVITFLPSIISEIIATIIATIVVYFLRQLLHNKDKTITHFFTSLSVKITHLIIINYFWQGR